MLLETIAVRNAQVEVLHWINGISGCLFPCFAIVLGVHVGDTPVATQSQRVVVDVLGTYAEAQSEVEALDVAKTAVILAEEAGLHVVQQIIIVIKNGLAVDTQGEVGTKVGIHAKVVGEVVAVTYMHRDLHVAGTCFHCCGQAFRFCTLHGVVDTCVDKYAVTARKHVLATCSQIEARLDVGICA